MTTHDDMNAPTPQQEASHIAIEIFSSALQTSSIRLWQEFLRALADFVEAPEVQSILHDPTLTETELGEALAPQLDILCAADNAYARLCEALIRVGKLTLAPDISDSYDSLREKNPRLKDVFVLYARPPGKAELDALCDLMESRFDITPSIAFTTDPMLMEGLKIIIDHEIVIDQTKLGYLARKASRGPSGGL